MRQTLQALLWVGVGGGIGSMARYLLSLAAQASSLTLPLGTLFIGVIAQLAAHADALTPVLRLLLATGFCGGFTTMSSLVYEVAQLLRDQEWYYAGLYFLGTLTGCFFCFYAGVLLTKLILER
jgi:CrcB protein